MGRKKLIEFDIEIKPVKLVRGQGLARLLAKENCKALRIDDEEEGTTDF